MRGLKYDDVRKPPRGFRFDLFFALILLIGVIGVIVAIVAIGINYYQ